MMRLENRTKNRTAPPKRIAKLVIIGFRICRPHVIYLIYNAKSSKSRRSFFVGLPSPFLRVTFLAKRRNSLF